MSRFYTLPVAARKQETSDAVSISFEIPAELKDIFAYKQGQYLTIQAEISGEKVRRAYSLSSCPVTDNMHTVTVKKVDGGKMSNKINNEFQVGSMVEVMPPQGRFYTEMNASQQKHYFLLGGGSGITPLISIIKTVLKSEPQSKCTLIYGNRNASSIIFKNELDAMAQQYAERLNIIYSIDQSESGWSGHTGILTAESIRQFIEQHQSSIANREYFICGPGGMMENAKKAVQSLGVNDANLHIEYFSAPVGNDTTVEVTAPAPDFEGSKVMVKLGGKEYELHIKDQSTILYAGIKAGIDPPFSCEAGICSTCMAKVIEGSVRMDENNILTDAEVKKGYVLTCQAHPTSKVVVLEYYE
jgi:ring-1,2-phenylacetyl-CoA epoxidase subunit PaaE